MAHFFFLKLHWMGASMLWRMCLNASSRVAAKTAATLTSSIVLVVCTAMLTQFVLASLADAQQPKLPLHYRHNSETMSPGEIGKRQLRHSVPMRGYYQPVRVLLPEGAKVSLANQG
ncbi:MAG: hypothetical protein ACI9G1_001754, partial [Pirellulaceae bacterium]